MTARFRGDCCRIASPWKKWNTICIFSAQVCAVVYVHATIATLGADLRITAAVDPIARELAGGVCP